MSRVWHTSSSGNTDWVTRGVDARYFSGRIGNMRTNQEPCQLVVLTYNTDFATILVESELIDEFSKIRRNARFIGSDGGLY